MSDKKINYIKDQLNPIILQIESHKIYEQIVTVDHVATFMSSHIYCVWDFMNLLTALQYKPSCISTPWKPVKNVSTVRLIHELVLEEASDCINGEYISHFLFYVKALRVLYPNKYHCADEFLDDLNRNKAYDILIQSSYLPPGVSDFLKFTYQCIQSSVLDVAAALTFGREVVIPSLFKPLVSQLDPEIKSKLEFFLL